jgi:hypothetical protein
MAAPTVYSESLFADYLASVLGPVADMLGWDAGSVAVQEAVNDALLEYGASSIADATSIRKLRAFGRRAIWLAVVQATAGAYTIIDNGQEFDRDQISTHAQSMLKVASAECMEFETAGVATMLRVKRTHDPYIILPDAERVR